MSTKIFNRGLMWLLPAAVLVLSGCVGLRYVGYFTDNPVADRSYVDGTGYMQQGFYDKAIPVLTSAIENDEHYVPPYINRALCYNELKQYKDALEDASAALRLNLKSSYPYPPAHAYYQKAIAEQGLHKYRDAAEDYESAARLETAMIYQYIEMAAKCYESAGQMDQAKKIRSDLSKATDPVSLVSRGIAEHDNGQYNDAIKDFTAAITADPNSLRAYYNRGLCEAILGQCKEALADCNKVLSLDSKFPPGYSLRGWVKFYLGDFQGAEEDFRQHLTINDMRERYYLTINDVRERHSPYSVIMCSLARRKIGQPDAALEILKWWQDYEYDKWPNPVLRYLRLAISASDVLSAANTNDLMTEAKTYIGLDYSLQGKTKEAIDYLTWVQNNGNRSFPEYELALSELNRLKGPFHLNN